MLEERARFSRQSSEAFLFLARIDAAFFVDVHPGGEWDIPQGAGGVRCGLCSAFHQAGVDVRDAVPIFVMQVARFGVGDLLILPEIFTEQLRLSLAVLGQVRIGVFQVILGLCVGIIDGLSVADEVELHAGSLR